ncbi:hypothetical protein LJR220_004035 [Bradyrhizobium sp. LjRoot220]|uniref:hypothetical protein n=1 Tax=Bradyrhizobium sp. LjRoot220 TaxID=3342284 RepID=UPI003ECFB7CC
MEKVENLYRTAREQNAMPRRLDHVVEICEQNASSFRDLAGACSPDFEIVARRFDLKSESTSEQSIAATDRVGPRRRKAYRIGLRPGMIRPSASPSRPRQFPWPDMSQFGAVFF